MSLVALQTSQRSGQEGRNITSYLIRNSYCLCYNQSLTSLMHVIPCYTAVMSGNLESLVYNLLSERFFSLVTRTLWLVLPGQRNRGKHVSRWREVYKNIRRYTTCRVKGLLYLWRRGALLHSRNTTPGPGQDYLREGRSKERSKHTVGMLR